MLPCFAAHWPLYQGKNFVCWVLQKVVAGLVNEVALLTKIYSVILYGKYLGLSRPATIMRSPLSEVSLYLSFSYTFFLVL